MADETSIATKAISEFEVKDAERGEVTAVVSVFNVVDRDRDVILPGAIKDGTVVKLSGYGHDVVIEGKAPAGKGVIRVDGDRAVFHGKYFMSTQRGQEAFAVVKELGPDSEWSIGFPNRLVRTAPMTKEWESKGARRVISGMDVREVSPVFVGANQYTSTVGTKEAKTDEELAAEKAAEEAKAAEERAILQAVADRMAEVKAAKEAEAAAQAEAEAKAAQEAETARIAAEAEAERTRIADMATKEFERFQRTMRRQIA